MDNKNRPTGRKKTVGEGSVHVGKDQKVESTGPVGTANRPAAGTQGRGSAPQSRPTQSSQQKGLGADLLGAAVNAAVNNAANNSHAGGTGYAKKPARRSGGSRLILLIAVLVIGYLLFRSMGSSENYAPSYEQQPQTQQTVIAAPTPTAAPASVPTPAPTAAPVNTVSNVGREKRIVPLGGGKDTVTVMVYMCGTDLESKYGMGTSDLLEMTKANISDKVNLIVETGGCSKWKNNIISSSKNQIYRVKTGGLELLRDDLGAVAMTDPNNLTSFIQYCAKNYPADRSILIFWDHGGGSLTGYGYDEKFPGSSSMTLTDIDAALSKAGVTFDWIGFDACLMATLETALVCNEYADYLVASEETEPGTGWYYTDWLTALSANTSIATPELAKTIIDTFVSASCASSAKAQVTLSLIDLAELQGSVPAAFRDFSTATTAMISSNSYATVSNARSGARQFAASSRINQIDLVDLCDRLGTAEAKTLASALRGCVKYNKSTISRANGVSVYFPYETLKDVKSAVSVFKKLGIDEEYTKCIQSFASAEQGGQMASASSYSGSAYSGSDMLSQLLESYLGSSSYGGSGSYGSASSSYGSYGSASSYGSPVSSLLSSYLGTSGGYGSSSASSGSYGISASDVMGLLSAFSGRSMPQQLDWVDTDLVSRSAASFAESFLDPARIALTEKNGGYVLSLTDEEWGLVNDIALNVYADDGEGFLDLGCDHVFEFDDDGDLLLDFDGTWLTMDGHLVSYYVDSYDDETGVTVGRIPAHLTRTAEGETLTQLVNLTVVFDENGKASLTGAQPLYENGETELSSKGNLELLAGDKLEFLCDFYDYDGNYTASYTLAGGALTLKSAEPVIENLALTGADGYSVTYRITDIYGNVYWTPAWILE